MNLCTCILKTLAYFFMEGPHPTVPSGNLVDVLASYISNNKFQFKFSLKKEMVNFNKKCLFSYIHTNVYIVCFSM